jgi:hypothetical protein
MAQPVLRIVLTDEERDTLVAWSRSTTGEHRLVERSRVILLAADGLPAREIARRLKTRLARVSKWRRRFCQERLAGLEDAASVRRQLFLRVDDNYFSRSCCLS